MGEPGVSARRMVPPPTANDMVAPSPMARDFSGGLVLMVLLTTLNVFGVASGCRCARYLGVQLLALYAISAVTLHLLPG